MIKAVIPALLIVAMAVSPASANFVTGNTLDEMCRGERKLFVMGYAIGIADMLERTAPDSICIPEGVSANQIVDILCKYLDENPTNRHMNADYLVIDSLIGAFRCKQ